VAQLDRFIEALLKRGGPPSAERLREAGRSHIPTRDRRLEEWAAIVWDDRRNWTDPSVLPLPPDAPLGAPDVYLNVLTDRP